MSGKKEVYPLLTEQAPSTLTRKHIIWIVSVLVVVAVVVPIAVIFSIRDKDKGNTAANPCSQAAAQIIQYATKGNSTSYQRLYQLTTLFGPRLSGSQTLEDALDWILAEMENDGLQNVHGENVTVPAWVRGNEYIDMLTPRQKKVAMLGLGSSVNTSSEGLTAEVLVVKSFQDLQQRALLNETVGKIILYNVEFVSYGTTVVYRGTGAIEAARVGAVGALVRSITPYSLYTPHTGNTNYQDNIPKIPFAAITLEDAELFQRIQDMGIGPITITMYMEAHFIEPQISRNIMGEIVGSEFPNEVVVVGGHTDSWDVGNGAQDDGGGVMVSWEAIRILHALGLKPKRTVRVVGWTNEENGLAGGNAYAKAHEGPTSEYNETHVFAIETDSGIFAPQGLGVTLTTQKSIDVVKGIGQLLDPIGSGTIVTPGGGADVGPLAALGVPVAGLNVDSSLYFWFHHSNSDTIDKVSPTDMDLCAATLATYVYCVANYDQSIRDL
eukprot:TRINITY_DN5466_c0_g1_i1.p1 TRINITY_DN5466_c0_g1~~TRINITY_DN5466_c0_g1_i1.p1  ORF type:complete len:495 (-),score=98.68 TRINITY_DN5466_c0_g1_i1:35-1519(-)